MPAQTAVVIGATGMIGEALVQKLIADENFNKIRLLVRRPLTYNEPKVEIVVVNFDDPAQIAEKLGSGDSLFCCVGTTRAKVKNDKTAYRKVDLDIPVNFGKQGLTNGFKNFLLVSAIGADQTSGNFYLQLKGSAENRLRKMSYPALHILQPSLLMGKRKEFRLGEKIAQALMPVFSVFLAGKLEKYKPIQADEVARAMVQAAKSQQQGTFVYRYKEIKAFAVI